MCIPENYPILDGVKQLQLSCYESSIELVITGNQQSNKELDWQKVFDVFWKYKNTNMKCI